MKLELVRDWMTRDVIVVTSGTLLPDADQLLTQHKVRRLPVVDDNGRLIGIVTQSDIRSASPSRATSLSMWEMNYLLSRLTISEIMTPNPTTISPDDVIATAAQTMLDHKISGLPVVDANGTLVGIITESDIFRLVAHHWAQSADDPTAPYAHYNQ